MANSFYILLRQIWKYFENVLKVRHWWQLIWWGYSRRKDFDSSTWSFDIIHSGITHEMFKTIVQCDVLKSVYILQIAYFGMI